MKGIRIVPIVSLLFCSVSISALILSISASVSSFGAWTCFVQISDRYLYSIEHRNFADLQGVQQNCSHLVICSYVGFYSCKLQKLGRFWKIQEICYKIGTRILKIDLEIAEIIEVKVGNHHLEIDILLLHRGRKIISMLKVATFFSIISAISKSNFKILVPFWLQISWIWSKCPNFWNLHE